MRINSPHSAWRHRLAAYRELSAGEQADLRLHATHCPTCARQLAAYECQEQALGALPEIPATFALVQVAARLTASSPVPVLQRAWAVAIVVLVLIGLSGGAVAASGEALPGNWLYPLKLGLEATERLFVVDDQARLEFEHEVAERRRSEAQRLLSLGRTAQMDIEGRLSGIQDGRWTVSGIPVSVGSPAWEGPPPPVGTQVIMRVAIQAREMRALRVSLVDTGPQSDATASPFREPPAGHGALSPEQGTPTPDAPDTPEGHRTVRPSAEQTSERPDVAVPQEPAAGPARSEVAPAHGAAPSVTPVPTVAPVTQPGPQGEPVREPTAEAPRSPAAPHATPSPPQGRNGASGGGGH